MKNTHLGTVLSLLLLARIGMAASVTSPENLPAYYQNLDQKSGASLWSAVQTVTKTGYSSLSYDGLWTAYKTTDLYPTGHAKAGKIWDMYGDCTFTYSSNQCGTYSSECVCYNREHSIPKSWFGGSTSSPGADIFHIVPTDGKVNGTRSNYTFGEVNSATYSYAGAKLGTPKTISISNTIEGSYTATCSSSTVFEPIDEYKGDFARGYMGTLLRWAGDYQAFTMGDGATIFSGTYTAAGDFGLTKYGIALLLKWHRQDPVSQKEIDRNNGIQATQGNRNPFIDYPDLAEYIWGSHAGEAFPLTTATATFSDDYDPETGGGGSVTTEPYDLILYRYGLTETLTKEGTFTLPTDETAPCEDYTFVGWSEAQVSSTTTKPTLITTVNAAQTVYAVYSITETTEGSGTGTTTTLTMSDLKATSGTLDGFTIATDKASGSTAPAYNEKAADLRIYANGTITISASTEMTEIVFAISAQGLKRLAPITASVGTIAEQASGDATVTWTGSATSVTFTVGAKATYGSDSSGAGQLCFTSMDITTGGSGSKTTITYTSDPECNIEQQTPTASFTFGDMTTTYGNGINNPFLTNSNGAVTYSSSDETVATVDATGAVTILGVGETTITATVAETTRYYGTSASYLLTVNKATPTIYFDEETLVTAIKVGSTVANNAYNDLGEITYASSDATVATVDENTGMVTGVAYGTATITASIAATANYNAASAEYDMVVTEVLQSLPATDITSNSFIAHWTRSGDANYTVDVYQLVEKEVTTGGDTKTTTLTMSDMAAASGTLEGFTIATAKESGSSAPVYNSGGADLRIYAKGTLTITASTEMTEIVFAISAQGKKRLAPITASVGTIAEQASGDATVTWTGSATSVTFTVGEKADYGSESTKAGQLCFTSIDITTGSEPVTKTVTAPQSITGYPAAVGSVNSLIVEGLEAETTYYYTVTADGVETEAQEVTTLEDVINTYIIRFVNYDGEELQEIEVVEGEMPEYTGATPQRADDEDYTYTFLGWNPELDFATEDMTYTATYTPEGKTPTALQLYFTSNPSARIYTLTGQLLTGNLQDLTQGIYIVQTEDKVLKIIVP